MVTANLFSAKPVEVVDPLVSILIPCVGMLEYTKLCVPSVLRHSRQPFELIFLDIGSLDGTAEYIAGLQAGAANIPIEVVRTQTDLGIKDVCKEALRRVHGDYLVLLNNDTVVTHGWLQQLIGLTSMTPTMGMTGPMTNYAAPPQLVETVPYRIGPRKAAKRLSGERDVLVDVQAVNEFAARFRDDRRGQWVEVDRLGGFCLLLKREVLRRVEQDLDRWTDLSLFDTDILSSKARQAGYMIGCCRDLFIHHFGTRTFAHGAPQADSQKERAAVTT
ncbi:MAG: glycosyltransferase family 2 protein [Planctomycetes bacterium]|nr:glycosyltransferase family 2 protein [Planctomycetota bacterium]